MKTTVDCKNWSEYEGMNGAVMFCNAGAYGKKLTYGEAKSCGCTELKREKCMKAMVGNMGYGLVPEVYSEAPVAKEVAVRELVTGLI